LPEGPEIRRVRDRLAVAIEGKNASVVVFYLPALKEWNGTFDGATITAIESRGKALLTHFDNGHTIYSHNQLYGRWLVVEPGAEPETTRQLRLAIHTDKAWALLYSASDIEVWPAGELVRHPFLKRLGPDVLAPGTTVATILERLQHPVFHCRQLGGFLTDQSFVAGLGNYLRCEIIFCAGLHPKQRPCDLGRETLQLLAEQILELPRQSYATGGITNELQRAKKLMNSGASFEEARFHIFRREGKPCYRCGSPIVQQRNAGQGCYLCPQCQR